jgi:hypothetical protein
MAPLNGVSGWLIDFETAKAIFDSGDNFRIDHIVELCTDNALHICHCEEKLFKGHPPLAAPFLQDNKCVCYPDKQIMQNCVNVSANPICKKLLKGNQTPIFLTAIASCRNLGMISDHRSPVFTTTFDLCTHFGIPALSSTRYFATL